MSKAVARSKKAKNFSTLTSRGALRWTSARGFGSSGQLTYNSILTSGVPLEGTRAAISAMHHSMTSLKAPSSSTPATKPAAPLSMEELGAALDVVRGLLASAHEAPSAYPELYVHASDLLAAVERRIREVTPESELTPEQLESVCILLGPFRNLTTLTCAVLGLHPNCAVLNHAGLRILPNSRLNFLADGSPDRFREFVRYAGFASRSGSAGPYGGDIRLSHAYEFEPTREAEARLRELGRGPTTSLVWKDLQHVTNYLRSAQVDVRALMQRNEKLRFLLPIRNPIDCAISNLRTGHFHFFLRPQLSAESPLEDVVDAVLDEIEWFIALRDRSGQAERFFIYFEHEMSREVLEQMLAFLALPRDERYLEAAAAAFRIGRPRRKEQAVIDRFAKQVSKKFQRHPQIRDGLLKFAKPSER